MRHVADDIPAYVIENTKGDRKVIHRALLLWLSCDKDQEGLQMTVDQLTIFVSLSALEPLPEGEKRCRVPYKWSITGFGLNLAIFKLMLEVSVLQMGPQGPSNMCGHAAAGRNWPTEEVWGGNQVYGRWWHCLVGDTLPWIRTHQVEPNLLLPEGKMKRVELSINGLVLSSLISTKRMPIG